MGKPGQFSETQRGGISFERMRHAKHVRQEFGIAGIRLHLQQRLLHQAQSLVGLDEERCYDGFTIKIHPIHVVLP